MVKYTPSASRTKRLINWIIDVMIIATISFVLIFPLTILAFKLNLLQWMEDGKTYDLGLFIIFIQTLYYLIFEWLFGTTIGKLLTRTKLIRLDSKKIRFRDVLIRTVCRLIPFDQLSYLSAHPIGWHDDLSDTRVVNIKDIKKIETGGNN